MGARCGVLAGGEADLPRGRVEAVSWGWVAPARA
jgi:hypothetical protein